MKIRKLKLSIFIWLFFSEILNAQTKKVYTIGGSYLIGSNINKNSDREFGPTNPMGAEVFFHRNHDGSKYWEKVYNYPHTGWSITWIDHRNKTLGNSFALNRYMNYVLWRKKYVEFYIKAAVGIMYATKTYETNSNNKDRFNNAISQPVSFSEQLGLGLYMYPVNYLSILIATTMTHFSNGAISQPNDGLNIWLLHLGLAYTTHQINASFYKQPAYEEDNRRIRVNINMGSGVKQLTPEDKTKYPLFSFSLYADKKLSRVSAINVGIDGFLNYGVKHAIENNTVYKGVDFKRFGVSAGHELFINRVGFLAQVGYHFYSPYPDMSRFYQKLGLKYYITDKLFASITLRTYKLQVSDEITAGIGLRF